MRSVGSGRLPPRLSAVRRCAFVADVTGATEAAADVFWGRGFGAACATGPPVLSLPLRLPSAGRRVYASKARPGVARPGRGTRVAGYFPMTNVRPRSVASMYFPSPAENVAPSGYEPGFWVSFRLTVAWPVPSVVPIADWVPRVKVTFFPTTGWPYSSTRAAVSTTIFEAPPFSGPV